MPLPYPQKALRRTPPPIRECAAAFRDVRLFPCLRSGLCRANAPPRQLCARLQAASRFRRRLRRRDPPEARNMRIQRSLCPHHAGWGEKLSVFSIPLPFLSSTQRPPSLGATARALLLLLFAVFSPGIHPMRILTSRQERKTHKSMTARATGYVWRVLRTSTDEK